MFLPNLLWNVQPDFPFLELMRNIKASGRDTVFTSLGYLRAQIFLMTPVTFSAWPLGALYFFFWTTGKPFRMLGWAFVTVAVTLILAGTLALLALFLPVLSPEAFLRYQASLRFSIQPDEKSMAMEPMPHYSSDCLGWEDMVPAAAKAHAMVPPEQRADTAIFAHNFAAAGAVDIVGPKYGLPKVISGHQNYRLWGPGNDSGQTVIVVGETPEGASRRFEEVTVVAKLHNRYAPPWENRPVLLFASRKIRRPCASCGPR